MLIIMDLRPECKSYSCRRIEIQVGSRSPPVLIVFGRSFGSEFFVDHGTVKAKTKFVAKLGCCHKVYLSHFYRIKSLSSHIVQIKFYVVGSGEAVLREHKFLGTGGRYLEICLVGNAQHEPTFTGGDISFDTGVE